MLFYFLYCLLQLLPAESADEGAKFNPGDMITHHIGDDYSWHFADGVGIAVAGNFERKNGLDVFSSSNFYKESNGEHVVVPYNGYVMEHGHIYYDNGHGHPRTEMVEGEEKHVGPLDFSITKNVASLLLSAALLMIIFFTVAGRYKTNRGKAPRGIQSFFEPIIIFIRDEVAKPEHRSEI